MELPSRLKKPTPQTDKPAAMSWAVAEGYANQTVKKWNNDYIKRADESRLRTQQLKSDLSRDG
jgi:hypothetical protein